MQKLANRFLIVLVCTSLWACSSTATTSSSYSGSGSRGYVRVGNTVYQTLPGSSLADFNRPVRTIQAGEIFDPNNPFASNNPHAQAHPNIDAIDQLRQQDQERIENGVGN